MSSRHATNLAGDPVGRRRSQLNPVGKALADPGAPPIEIDRACSSCGKRVHQSVPVPRFAALATLLREQATGERSITCDDCIDRQEREQDEREAAHREQNRRERARARAGIPLAFRGLTFEGLDHDADRVTAIDAAKACAAGTTAIPGLYLYGRVGCGKTYILAAAAEAFIRAVRPVRWLNVALLLTNLRRPYDSPDYGRASEQLRPARPGEVLVLDDLDKAESRERDLQVLYVAIDGWQSAGAPLLVSANGDLDRLVEHYGTRFGEPIASRLVGHCLDVKVGGRDRRLAP